MSSNTIHPRLKKNIDALLQKNPILGAQLEFFEANQKYDVYIGKDPLNINIYDKENKVAIYNEEPLSEISQKIKEFEDYKFHPFLYFFGIGNGIFYKTVLKNAALKTLTIFEPELELIYIALNFADFSEEILSDKLQIFWTKTCDFTSIYNHLSDEGKWIYFKTYNLHIYNGYYGRYSQECIELNSIFTRAFEHHIIGVGNDSTDALMGLENHINNLPKIIHTNPFHNFIKKSKNTNTAIIVSTGPSLYKQLPLLKEYAPFVTIFCVDASFPILTKHGIKPDVVVTLERVKETAEFFIQTPKEAQKDVIFAITSISHPSTIDAISQGVQSFSMRPFGYTRYFDLKEYGYAGIGMSAANLAFELIVYSKFERCIFIGQDLSFAPDGRTHSKDAIYGEEEAQYKKETNTQKQILLPAYGGNGIVKSTTVWQMFLNFLEKDIAECPYEMEIINATEGGARIAGTKEIPFKNILESLPKTKKKPIKLDLPLKSKVTSNEKKIQTKIKSLLNTGTKMQKKIEKTFLKVAKMTEELQRLNKEKKLEKINWKKMDSILDEIDKVKELFKQQIFIQLFSDAVQSYIVHQELEFAKIVVRPVKTITDKQVKQIDWLFAHKFWLFSLAGGMNATLEIVKRSAKNWMELPREFQETQETK